MRAALALAVLLAACSATVEAASDALEASADGLEPGFDDLKAASDGLEPAFDDLKAAPDGLEPAFDDLKAASDGLEPAFDDLKAVSDGLEPGFDDLKAASDGVEPAFDGLDAAALGGTPGCGAPLTPGSSTRTVQVGGAKRTYLLHVPKGYSGKTPRPVVLAFHGYLDDAAKMEKLTGLSSAVESKGWLVVYGQGTAGAWNTGLCCAPANTLLVDEVAYVAAVLDDLEQAACVDAKRVYATGFSNGGYLAHKLGCQLADRVAAIAPVAGTLTTVCQPSRPVPVLMVHGTGDLVVPYWGQPLAGALSVEGTTEAWRKIDGCPKGKPGQVWQQGDSQCVEVAGCQANAVVRVCTVENGGHQWPGSPVGPLPLFGKLTKDLDATAQMLEFFAAFTLP